ncbi:MAG: phosphate/phosphite/phosphonate ABC transporter substrate-binding protein [Anaerolineales bacterium]|nr:phosphate/phosphite/phosphonate ABC transporter substrate-binding protein [Chloroflexota bacterium]MBL6980253.1 phosphate/phosphite/phosphonate ABC transporter substrate-binding protein [Anaerolineales bacterium]
MVGRKLFVATIVGTLSILLTACTPSEEQTSQVTAETMAPIRDQIIILGDISDDPSEVIDGSQPLADYLASNLRDYGITEGQVKIAATMDEMTQLLKNREVDLYFDSVYPATIISDASGALPILRRWRFGVEEYYTVIFASEESGITSIEDLLGHMIAMDAPYSTSGYLLPAAHLVEGSINLVGKHSYNDSVADNEVGFVFSYDDENTVQWVLRGLTAAGATDDYHYYVAFPEETTDKLVVLAKTDSIPRQIVIVRSGVNPKLLEAITRILTTAHETEEGQIALEAFQTSRFDEFPEGIETAAEQMRQMIEIVQGLSLP